MSFSGGMILFILTFGLLILPKRSLKYYAVCSLLAVTVHHWFMPPAGTFSFSFMDFGVSLFHFRALGRLIGLSLSFFALMYFIFTWSEKLSRFFYVFSFLHIASGLTILFVNDFLSFFILWEMLTISAVVLILIDGSPSKLIRKYFIYQMVGTISLLTGIAVNYSLLGTVELSPQLSVYPLFLLAVFVKAAVMPFHFWLPATYPRVSLNLTVLLSAYVTKIGVFSVILLVPVLSLEVVGALLAFVAVLCALKQERLRNFLSYHIISQIGYMLAGLSGATILANVGGTYHVVSHVLYKGLLFMIVAVLTVELGAEKIQGNGGLNLSRRYPLLFISALVASASITGLPPFNGFISKSILVAGLESSLAANLLLLTSFGTGFSFMKFLYFSFLKPGGNNQFSDSAFNSCQKLAVFSLSSACLFLGIVPNFLLSTTAAAGMDFYYPQAVSKGLLPGLVAILLFIFLFDEISEVARLLIPDFIPGRPTLKKLFNICSDNLQALHNGNLQRYLVWFFSTLLFFWLFTLLKIKLAPLF